MQTLVESHNRYVKLLKEEIVREKEDKLKWKEKYERIREGARALSDHAAVIAHLEAHIQEQDKIIYEYQKAHTPTEFLIDEAIQNGSLK